MEPVGFAVVLLCKTCCFLLWVGAAGCHQQVLVLFRLLVCGFIKPRFGERQVFRHAVGSIKVVASERVASGRFRLCDEGGIGNHFR